MKKREKIFEVEIPFPAPKEPKFTFIDLFAGIGGFRLAMQELGGKCVFSSEWDHHARITYEANFGETPRGDITKIDEKEIPEHDILCAGFPCQAFSIAGKQNGFNDTRGTLFFDIVRILMERKPKAVFLENVKNLKAHDKKKTLKTILHSLKELGYRVFYKVLNTRDFGLPQNRERIYIVAFRLDVSSDVFLFPEPLQKAVALNDLLEKEPQGVKNVERDDIKINRELKLETTIFGELSLPNKPVQIGIVNKGGQGERIYHPSGHAITLSAHGGGAGSKTGLYLVDGKIRKLSVRECARVQGFPDSFIVNPVMTHAYKQFGNSVSINVIRKLSEKIITHMGIK
ncbi:MAG: DNA cytosine methyltransferase [bacterium]